MNLVNKRWAWIHWLFPHCTEREREGEGKSVRGLNISRHNERGFIWAVIIFPTEVQWGDKWERQRWHRFSTGGPQRSNLPAKRALRWVLINNKYNFSLKSKLPARRTYWWMLLATGKKIGVRVHFMWEAFPAQETGISVEDFKCMTGRLCLLLLSIRGKIRG